MSIMLLENAVEVVGAVVMHTKYFDWLEIVGGDRLDTLVIAIKAFTQAEDEPSDRALFEEWYDVIDCYADAIIAATLDFGYPPDYSGCLGLARGVIDGVIRPRTA